MKKSKIEQENKSVGEEYGEDSNVRGVGREQYRVVINGEANEVLESATKSVNDGFSEGMILKSDIANYVFLNLKKYLDESDFKKLRCLHFDDKKVLTSILKNSDEQNDLPEEIKKALREHYGIIEKDKKRGLKNS